MHPHRELLIRKLNLKIKKVQKEIKKVAVGKHRVAETLKKCFIEITRKIFHFTFNERTEYCLMLCKSVLK